RARFDIENINPYIEVVFLEGLYQLTGEGFIVMPITDDDVWFIIIELARQFVQTLIELLEHPCNDQAHQGMKSRGIPLEMLIELATVNFEHRCILYHNNVC